MSTDSCRNLNVGKSLDEHKLEHISFSCLSQTRKETTLFLPSSKQLTSTSPYIAAFQQIIILYHESHLDLYFIPILDHALHCTQRWRLLHASSKLYEHQPCLRWNGGEWQAWSRQLRYHSHASTLACRASLWETGGALPEEEEFEVRPS